MKKIVSVILCVLMLVSGCCVFASAEEEKTVSWISIAAMPDKTEYVYGEDFDDTGLKVEIHYSDGSSEIIDSGFSISGNLNHKGTRYYTIEYQGHTAMFSVTVIYKTWQKVVSVLLMLVALISNGFSTFVSYF